MGLGRGPDNAAARCRSVASAGHKLATGRGRPRRKPRTCLTIGLKSECQCEDGRSESSSGKAVPEHRTWQLLALDKLGEARWLMDDGLGVRHESGLA